MHRERARIGKDGEQRRARREGMTLLRALWLTFRGRILLSAVATIVESTVHIAQVGGWKELLTERWSAATGLPPSMSFCVVVLLEPGWPREIHPSRPLFSAAKQRMR